MDAEIGIQSYTYQEETIDEFCETVESLDVDAVELYPGHLGPESTTERRDRVRDRLEDAGVEISGIGVYSIDGGTDVEPILALADDLGCAYVSVGFASAEPSLVDPVLDGASARGLSVAVHNTPKGAFATIEEVADLLASYEHDWFGACLDTGNFVDAGDSAEAALSAFGDRVVAVHLKGFYDEAADPVDGTDVIAFLTDLAERSSFEGTPMIEYEVNPSDPTPAVEALLRRVNDADAE